MTEGTDPITRIADALERIAGNLEMLTGELGPLADVGEQLSEIHELLKSSMGSDVRYPDGSKQRFWRNVDVSD